MPEYHKLLCGKSVLIVDDSDIVGDVIVEALSPIVSAVKLALDGVDALALVMEEEFDIILLDIEMPRMDGIEFFKHLAKLKPRLQNRVIFITGDAETPSTRAFIKSTGCRCLSKPFMIRDLLRVMACA